VNIFEQANDMGGTKSWRDRRDGHGKHDWTDV